MTNWQDKYKDVDFCKPVWYWHKTESLSGDWNWTPIRVARLWSTEKDCYDLFAYGISQNSVPISEHFPDGPKCIVPEEADQMQEKIKELEKDYEELWYDFRDIETCS